MAAADGGDAAWGARAEAARAQARFTRRAVVLGLVQIGALGGLTARLYDLQVLNGAQQAALGEDNRTRTVWLIPRRGRISDATGRVLADSRESFRVVLYPQRGLTEADARRIVTGLTPYLRLSPEAQEAVIARATDRVRRAPVVLSDALGFDDVAALQVASLDASNVVIEPVWQRLYATLNPGEATALAHVLGHVGAVDRLGVDDPVYLRLPGVRVGKAGVEAGLEPVLRGLAGRRVYEIDARARHVRRLDDTAAVDGTDVRLTLDVDVQTAVVARLKNARETGAVVVLDVATGGVRALASTPAFEASALRGADAAAAWRRLSTDSTRPLLNRATAGQYPPGSTFKIVTALAALEAGQVAVTERIDCTGQVTYAGHTFRCWNRAGHISSDLHKAMRESCDCYFYEIARRTGIERIAAMATELGLGQTYDLGLAPQAPGLMPTPAWKRGRARGGWLLGETILAGIGQGYVLTTPLQLAVMTARIASGRKVAPTLLAPPAGEPTPAYPPLAVSERALDLVRRALVAVVNEAGGTGSAAAVDIEDEDGDTIEVAGKTGTSQVSRASADRDRRRDLARKLRDHAVFVAYAPADAPRYAVAAILEHAGSGGSEAGPLVRDVLRLVLRRRST